MTQTLTCVKELQGNTSMQSRKNILASDCEQTDALAQGNKAGRSCVLSAAVAAGKKSVHTQYFRVY